MEAPREDYQNINSRLYIYIHIYSISMLRVFTLPCSTYIPYLSSLRKLLLCQFQSIFWQYKNPCCKTKYNQYCRRVRKHLVKNDQSPQKSKIPQVQFPFLQSQALPFGRETFMNFENGLLAGVPNKAAADLFTASRL